MGFTYTHYYIKKNQQGPLYSTGKSTQYSVVTYMGKESEKEYIYIYTYSCLVAKLCLTLCGPMDYIAHQASLSMGFSRQE